MEASFGGGFLGRSPSALATISGRSPWWRSPVRPLSRPSFMTRVWTCLTITI